MRRLTPWLLTALLACVLALPQSAQARKKGWKDLLLGMGVGTVVGTTLGGMASRLTAPQKYQDYIAPYYYAGGAGAGLMLGTVGGALVGYLPLPDEKKDNDVTLGSAPIFEVPILYVAPVKTTKQKVSLTYCLYPINLRF